MRLLFIFCCIFAVPETSASPLSDLASPLPEVRSTAAKLIRDSHLYHATSRVLWDKLASSLREDSGAQDILPYLQKNGIALRLVPSDLASNGVYHFRLDDSWVLLCAFNQSILTEFKVVEEPKEIVVLPPNDYTGFWRMYRIDGEPEGLRYYKNGKDFGRLHD